MDVTWGAKGSSRDLSRRHVELQGAEFITWFNGLPQDSLFQGKQENDGPCPPARLTWASLGPVCARPSAFDRQNAKMMLGVGDILAITSLVMQVVASVQTVIDIFEKAQNAPKELEQLRVSLIRMSRHFDMIRAKHESTGSSLIHKDDTDEIFDTLLCCKALFDEYEKVRSRNGVLQAIWGNQQSDMVARYQLRIDRHFTQILVPLWITVRYSDL
jgi:hypothetical protein